MSAIARAARVALAALPLALLVAPALTVAAALAPLPQIAAACAGAGLSHAAVVVEHGNGTTVTRCVAFAGTQISGEGLLKASGISYRVQSFGGFGDAICQVDGEPQQYASCLGTGSYWSLFSSRGGAAWQFASVGISNLVIHDGDAEGFRYEPQSGSPLVPPSPSGVCPAAAPSPAATPIPTPRPTARPTPRPLATPTAAPRSAPPVTPAATSAASAATNATPSSAPSPTAPDGASPSSTAAALAAERTPAGTPAAPAAGSASGGGGASSGVPAGAAAAAIGGAALLGLIAARSRRRPERRE